MGILLSIWENYKRGHQDHLKYNELEKKRISGKYKLDAYKGDWNLDRWSQWVIILDQRIRSRDDEYGVIRMLEDQDNLGDKDLFWVKMRDERT